MKIFQWRGRTSKTAFRDRFRTALQERIPDAAIQEIGELDLCIERPPEFSAEAPMARMRSGAYDAKGLARASRSS
jgi:hypothetical protein